jgi:hypothetical protein
MAIVHRTMGNILSNEAAHQSSKNCAALIIEAENNPAPERPVHRSLSCWLKPNRFPRRGFVIALSRAIIGSWRTARSNPTELEWLNILRC